jgi:hypothetical protein
MIPAGIIGSIIAFLLGYFLTMIVAKKLRKVG